MLPYSKLQEPSPRNREGDFDGMPDMAIVNGVSHRRRQKAFPGYRDASGLVDRKLAVERLEAHAAGRARREDDIELEPATAKVEFDFHGAVRAGSAHPLGLCTCNRLPTRLAKYMGLARQQSSATHAIETQATIPEKSPKCAPTAKRKAFGQYRHLRARPYRPPSADARAGLLEPSCAAQ
jgi:hypothetical protein